MNHGKLWMIALLAVLAGVGCHKSTNVTITVTPDSTEVLINNSVQFSPTVSNSSAGVTWEVNGITGGTPSANCGVGSTSPTTVCYGTITTNGVYTAPALVPSNSLVTITATVIGTSVSTTASVTIVSGVQVVINNAQQIATIGTGETIDFSATVSGVPSGATGQPVTINGTNYPACNSNTPNLAVTPPILSCNAVVWSVNSAGGMICSSPGPGCINTLTGVYTAPVAETAPGLQVTATSIFDSNRIALATINLVVATNPTLNSVGPNSGARGAVFQDVYLTGSNFISTTSVLINGVQVPPTFVSVSSVTCAAISTSNTSGTSTPTPPCLPASLSNGATLMRVRIPDYFLSTSGSFTLPSTNSVALNFTVQRQNSTTNPSTPVSCTNFNGGAANPTACEVILSPVRPSISGVSPDSVTAGGSVSFAVDGGYFGTQSNIGGGSSPVVTVQFNGQPQSFQVSGANTAVSTETDVNNLIDRQLTVTNATGASGPGTYEVGVSSQTSGLPPAISNLSIQPAYTGTTTGTSPARVPLTGTIGSMPVSVAIDTATGVAVVANQNSNDVALINLNSSPPAVITSICTGGVGQSEPCPGTAAGNTPNSVAPSSVAVDNIQHIALVTNSAAGTLAVIGLPTSTAASCASTCAVLAPPVNLTAVLNATDNQNPVNVSTTPIAVGLNPVVGRALVAFRGADFGLLVSENLNSTSPPPVTNCNAANSYGCIVGVVGLSTGTNPRVAASPNLDWMLVTPGGAGLLSIVNPTQQNSNVISSTNSTGFSRSAGTVTVNTNTTTALQVGEPILIEGATDPTYDGLYTVATVPTSTSFTYTQLSTLPNNTAGSGTVFYSAPVASLSISNTVTGVAIDDITSKAILADPGSAAAASIFNILDQSTSSPINTGPSGTFTFPSFGMFGAAFNPLSDIAVTVNETNSTGYIISPGQTGQNPIPPSVLSTFTTGSGSSDVAIDPGTDTAVVINQGDNDATVISLSAAAQRTPQILEVQANCNPSGFGSTYMSCSGGISATANGQAGPNQIYVPSSLTAAPNPSNVYLTIIGKGFSSGSPTVRVDNQPLATTVVSDRVIEAILPPSMQMSPRHYALDVDASGTLSNSLPLTVIVAVNITTTAPGCNGASPSPIGVAIDAPNNIAAVTDINCGALYLIDLTASTGRPIPIVNVGSGPLGVAVSPAPNLAEGSNNTQDGLVLVANSGSGSNAGTAGNSVSLIDDVTGAAVTTNNATPGTIPVETFPTGVAIDALIGQAMVTANSSNDLDTFSISINPSTPSNTTAETYTPTAVGAGPAAVAVDTVDHVAAVADQAGNAVSLVPLISSTLTPQTVTVLLPSGIVYDSVNDNFLIASALSNTVTILSPVTLQSSTISVGINPSSIAYNPNTGTLVTVNTNGGNMVLVDMIAQVVRSVMPISASSEFAVDIHPILNEAVVSDGANSRVLLVPLP